MGMGTESDIATTISKRTLRRYVSFRVSWVSLHLEGFLPEGEQRIVVRQDVMHIDLWSWFQKKNLR